MQYLVDAQVEVKAAPTTRHWPLDRLDGGVKNHLLLSFGLRRAAYIATVLSSSELAVLSDLADALVIARIHRYPPARLAHFDQYVPINAAEQKAYELAQVRWLKDAEYLLGCRLGRSPTHKELFGDFMRNRTGQRFRAYYVLKYPQRIRRRSASVLPRPTAA